LTSHEIQPALNLHSNSLKLWLKSLKKSSHLAHYFCQSLLLFSGIQTYILVKLILIQQLSFIHQFLL